MIAFKITVTIRLEDGSSDFIRASRVSESAHEATEWAWEMFKGYDIVRTRVSPIKRLEPL